MTNTPPNGAFRGFGAPQTQFAVEVHMDRIAEPLGIDPVELRERQRAAARRHDGDRPGARPTTPARCEVLREAVRRTDFVAQAARSAQGTDRGHRPVAVLPRLRLHRQRRGEAGVAGGARAHRRPARASCVAQHRDRPGHAHDARADRRRRARHRRTTRWTCRAPTPRACPTAGRRWRRAPAWSSAGMLAALRAPRCASGSAASTPARVLPRSTARSSSRAQYERPPGIELGRRHLSRRRVRHLRLGAATSSRSRSIRDTWRGAAARTSPRSTTSARPSTRCWPRARSKAARAGHRLRAARRGRHARRPRWPTRSSPTTSSRRRSTRRRIDVVDPREPVRARAVRRQGRRRDADRRPGAGGRQRAAPCRARRARDSGDAGAAAAATAAASRLEASHEPLQRSNGHGTASTLDGARR